MKKIIITVFFILIQIYCEPNEESTSKEKTSFLIPLRGNSNDLAYYFATIYIGEEKSFQSFLIDTSNSLTTAPCSKCKEHCETHIYPYYTVEKDSQLINCYSNQCHLLSNKTCINNSCYFSQGYTEDAYLEGVFVNTKAFFPNIEDEKSNISDPYNILIGCTLNETDYFRILYANGVMGLNNNPNSFVSMLYSKNILQTDLFTVCLGENGGYLSLGKINIKFHLQPKINYIPYTTEYDYYNLKLDSIAVLDGTDIKNKYRAILDTGTTLTYFPYEIYERLIIDILLYCKENGNKCGTLTHVPGFGFCTYFEKKSSLAEAITDEWPDIQFTFGEYVFEWKAKNYHIEINDHGRYRACTGFEGHTFKNIVLGTTFMHNFDVVFARNKKLIGFVEADCSREHSVNETVYDPSKKFYEDFEDEYFKDHKTCLIANIGMPFFVTISIVVSVLLVMVSNQFGFGYVDRIIKDKFVKSYDTEFESKNVNTESETSPIKDSY